MERVSAFRIYLCPVRQENRGIGGLKEKYDKEGRNMREINNEMLQKIRMCVKTFVNLYGKRPSVQEMVNWLGSSYEKVVKDYMNMPVMAC